MARTVVYTCDVCKKTLDKPAKVHLTANIGKKVIYADVCTPECGAEFVNSAFKSDQND